MKNSVGDVNSHLFKAFSKVTLKERFGRGSKVITAIFKDLPALNKELDTAIAKKDPSRAKELEKWFNEITVDLWWGWSYFRTGAWEKLQLLKQVCGMPVCKRCSKHYYSDEEGLLPGYCKYCVEACSCCEEKMIVGDDGKYKRVCDKCKALGPDELFNRYQQSGGKKDYLDFMRFLEQSGYHK